MTTRDTLTRYGLVSRLLHWSMALLFLIQFAKFFDRIDDGEHWLGELIGPIHGSVGGLIMLLALVRIGWALSQRERPPQQGPTAVLASIGHKLLYLLMVAMPATGSAYVVGNGYGLKLFGVQLIERSGVETLWLIALGEWHSPLAWLTLLTVAGHVGAALLHHFVFKDDTLRRMA